MRADQAVYFTCVNFFFSFFNDFLETNYLTIHWTDFYSPNDRYLFIDDRSGRLIPIPQEALPWQPIFGEILAMTFIRQTVIPKRKQYGSSNSTRGSAMAEGPRDALVSRNSATTKHPI